VGSEAGSWRTSAASSHMGVECDRRRIEVVRGVWVDPRRRRVEHWASSSQSGVESDGWLEAGHSGAELDGRGSTCLCWGKGELELIRY